MDPSYKPHIALDKYSTMQHFVTEMCTYVYISVTKWCIVGVGYLSNALWTLHSRSYIDCSFDNQVTLTDMGKITDFKRQHDTAKLEPCAYKSWDVLHVCNLEAICFLCAKYQSNFRVLLTKAQTGSLFVQGSHQAAVISGSVSVKCGNFVRNS